MIQPGSLCWTNDLLYRVDFLHFFHLSKTEGTSFLGVVIDYPLFIIPLRTIDYSNISFIFWRSEYTETPKPVWRNKKTERNDIFNM